MFGKTMETNLRVGLPRGTQYSTPDGPCGPDHPHRLAMISKGCGFWTDDLRFIGDQVHLTSYLSPHLPKCPGCGEPLIAMLAEQVVQGAHLPAKDRDPRYLEFIRDSKGVCMKALGGMYPAWQASLAAPANAPPHSPASAMPPSLPRTAPTVGFGYPFNWDITKGHIVGDHDLPPELKPAPDPRGEPVSYMVMARCHNADIPLFTDPHEKCARSAAASLEGDTVVRRMAEKIFPFLKPFTPHILSIGFIPIYKGGNFGEYVAVNVVEAGQGLGRTDSGRHDRA